MQVTISTGGTVRLKAPQQVWQGNEILQMAVFAGQGMMAITDDEGVFGLLYLDVQSQKFPTMEDAKAAAPDFAQAVLQHMISRIVR